MPHLQINDVPVETHAVLRRRAALAHQSLQEYLLSRLVAEAETPTLDEVLDRAGRRAGGRSSFSDARRILDEDRAGRRRKHPAARPVTTGPTARWSSHTARTCVTSRRTPRTAAPQVHDCDAGTS